MSFWMITRPRKAGTPHLPRLLATYLVLVQRNDVTSLKTFFEKCRKMAKRTNQPVVAGAASLLALHLSDPDHPQHPGLSKGDITAASVLFHLYGKREYDKKMYSL